MCKLINKLNREAFIGWKVISIKDGKLFSPATGCQYPMNGDVPIVRKQKRTCSFFISNLLRKDQYYSKEMVGRTAVFKRKKDAIILLDNIVCASNIYDGFSRFYKYMVVKAKVSKDLMSGKYGYNSHTIAGKHVEFMLTPEQMKTLRSKHEE
jgi:hypothetical protein